MSDTAEDPNLVAMVTDYGALRKAIADRRREIGWTQREADHLIGLAQGHLGKLECGAKGFGPMSFEVVLAGLGLRLAVLRDPTATVRPKSPCLSAYAVEAAA